jgi:hypothetical protein
MDAGFGTIQLQRLGFGFKFGGYYQGIYNNYKLNPTFPDKYFTGEILRIDTAANIKTSNYWAANRPVPLTPLETRDYQKKDSVAAYHKTEAYLDTLQHTKNNINYPGLLSYLATAPAIAPNAIRFISFHFSKRFTTTRLKVLV